MPAVPRGNPDLRLWLLVLRPLGNLRQLWTLSPQGSHVEVSLCTTGQGFPRALSPAR